MIIGNEQAASVLKRYIENVITSGTGTQFFILEGPNGIGKISHAKTIINEFLGNYVYSDCLFVQDYEPFTGKKHTIPVEIKDEDKRYTKFSDETLHENYGVREMNEWLLNSSFSGMKFLLIENIQRMSNSAINAFLKSAEEPIQNRFIIATVPHISMVLDTIRSRSIVIKFSPLTLDEMNQFINQNQIYFSDNNLSDIIISMAMGRPGFLINLSNKIKGNEDLEKDLIILTKGLTHKSFPVRKVLKSLKNLSEYGLLNDFVEGWIAYCANNGDYEQSGRWIKVQRYISSNVNLESALLYGII